MSAAADRNDCPKLALSICNSAIEEDNMKKIALITTSLMLLAAPAIAQDHKTVGEAPAEAKYSTVAKDEMFSSKLKGLNVYNQKDESIGEITDLAIKNHEIDALILSVGGFLGVGEHYVAVSPASVNVRYDSKNDKWLASMNTTKDALKAAPEFKYPTK
jgi:sporulation protein YlmC with PRC-barrel domain